MTTDQTRRTALKSKVAKSRSELSAKGTAARTLEAAAKRPLTLLAGGIVAGLIVGAFLPRRLGRKLVRYGITGATVASELGRNYGRSALGAAGEASREGRQKLEVLGETAGAYGRKAITATEARAREGRKLGVNLVRQGLKIASNLRH